MPVDAINLGDTTRQGLDAATNIGLALQGIPIQSAQQQLLQQLLANQRTQQMTPLEVIAQQIRNQGGQLQNTGTDIANQISRTGIAPAQAEAGVKVAGAKNALAATEAQAPFAGPLAGGQAKMDLARQQLMQKWLDTVSGAGASTGAADSSGGITPPVMMFPIKNPAGVVQKYSLYDLTTGKSELFDPKELPVEHDANGNPFLKTQEGRLIPMTKPDGFQVKTDQPTDKDYGFAEELPGIFPKLDQYQKLLEKYRPKQDAGTWGRKFWLTPAEDRAAMTTLPLSIAESYLKIKNPDALAKPGAVEQTADALFPRGTTTRYEVTEAAVQRVRDELKRFVEEHKAGRSQPFQQVDSVINSTPTVDGAQSNSNLQGLQPGSTTKGGAKILSIKTH